MTRSAGRPAKTGYIRTLDGWRAIAISGVILYHSRPIAFGGAWVRGVQAFGENGVQLFFAISGFLICSRLLEERRLWGQISLRGFYLRRLFRIQPAAIVYLAVLGLLTLAGILHVSLPATLSALFLYRNYFAVSHAATRPDDIYTAHYWSLSVEEHFYLFLPSLIYFGRRHLRAILTVLVVLSTLWAEIAGHVLRTSEPGLDHWRTDIALHTLLIPSLLAVLLLDASFRAWLTRVTDKGLLILLAAIGIVGVEVFLKGHLLAPLLAFSLPLVVLSTVLHPETWLGRLLESLPVVFIGRISYSLYLWQQLFLTHESGASSLGGLQRAPWNLVAVVLCATASYYLVEKPLMRLGHRLAPPATPGRPDLMERKAAPIPV